MIGSNKETFYLIPTFHTLRSKQTAIFDWRGERMQEGQVLWVQVEHLALQNPSDPQRVQLAAIEVTSGKGNDGVTFTRSLAYSFCT